MANGNQSGSSLRGNKTQENTLATLSDLNSLRHEMHTELSGLRGDIVQFQREIQNTLTQKTETNWGTVMAALAVVLVLVGMAASLAYTVIDNESTARLIGDTHTAMIDRMRSENAAKVEYIEEKRQDDIADLVEQVSMLRVESNKQELKTIDRVLQDRTDTLSETIKNLITTVNDDFDKFDTVLQREMRLLDEILQREMGLHVTRLEDLTAVNTKDIENLSATLDRLDARLNQVVTENLNERISEKTRDRFTGGDYLNHLKSHHDQSPGGSASYGPASRNDQ